ncbi:class C beta-lactamase-related serine hydrolase [Idiomarina sp. 29L]|uniref:serine hydrolase domain-containing protein n=1 Tax=Idiomarina sp. 29L TaxID=2508877 RepID=UPI0010134E26|nr:serine hydrolase [Idiomarina sp. 29L]RXS41529.1 class C beta-lactamase-related serine hydrolase [Idiomarina sp. 29L]
MNLTRLSLLMLCCLILVACFSQSQQNYNSDTSQHEWEVSELEKQNIKASLIKDMHRKLLTDNYPGISSVLLVRNNKLVFETYFNNFDKDKLHSTRSASKVITSLLIGIAIDKGYIKSVNESVFAYFPEYNGKIEHWDPRKNDISIAHVLSMTSGVKGNEDAMYPTDDWIKFYLDQPLVADPGSSFSYATSGVVTLGNIISRASGMSIPEFADKFLFEPMGIDDVRWPITNSLNNQGLAMTGGGLNMRPRDMAKIGQLILNQGQWKGGQLVSESWINESTQKHATSNFKGEDFGYLWRMRNRNINGQTIHSIEAWGNGGQFIMIFPKLELVAVFTGEYYGQFPEMEQAFGLLEEYILPAVN